MPAGPVTTTSEPWPAAASETASCSRATSFSRRSADHTDGRDRDGALRQSDRIVRTTRRQEPQRRLRAGYDHLALSAPSDSPPDPETGRVIDPEVLAEHRARRAELTEEGLVERAQRAERLVSALELRLAEAEDRGVTAERDRGTLATHLERTERELTAARQREFAEQRRRIELEGDVGGVVRHLEEETVRLRTEHRAAEERAAELTRALVRAHTEVDGARARAQAAREQAERTLGSQRERAGAHVTRLQQELARRATVHDAVGAQIAELRGALETVRARADAAAALTAKPRPEAEAIVEAVRARAASLEGELEEERRQRAALETRLEVERARFAAKLASSEEVLRAKLDSDGDARLAAATNELHAARARAEGAEAARRILEAELAERMRLAQPMHEALEALYEELAEERLDRAGRAARAAAVEGLVADLIATAHGLRAGFERELEALALERDARLASERERFAAVLAEVEERVAGLRGQLVVAARQLREQPGEEQAERPNDQADLVRETTERAAADQRATADLDALTAEVERLRAAERGNPIYDALSSGPLVPPADHPALVSTEASGSIEGAEAPAVVADLMRAAARLRAASEEPRQAAVTDEEQLAPASPVPVAPPERATAPASRVPAASPVAPTKHAWFAPALVALAAVDAATAERVLVAALPVQAARVAKDVEYELELPATGRHRVRVGRRGDVVVATAGPHERGEADFRIEGSVAVLAPLAAGAAPRRLRGVEIRGHRRRLRRLLRALKAPIGLPELQAAGARPRPGDLLALLCLGVPAAEVRGADFGVAYVVRDAGGRRVRTLVRAEPDGSLTAIPEAPDLFPADATVTVDANELLGVLAGSTPVSPEGDAQAVEKLQRWLRRAQGLPA
jgi:hypothetical protein